MMDHLQTARVDPRKQALLEARFGTQNKVNIDKVFHKMIKSLFKMYNAIILEKVCGNESYHYEGISLEPAHQNMLR